MYVVTSKDTANPNPQVFATYAEALNSKRARERIHGKGMASIKKFTPPKKPKPYRQKRW